MEPQLWASDTAHEVPQLCPQRPHLHAAMMSLPGTTVLLCPFLYCFPRLQTCSSASHAWPWLHHQNLVRPVCSSGQWLQLEIRQFNFAKFNWV